MAKAPRFVKYPQLVLSCSQIRVILHKWTFTPSQLLSEVLVPIRSWSTWASSGQWKGRRWFMEKQPAISFGKIWEVCSEYICFPSGLVLLPVPALKAWSLQCPQSTLTNHRTPSWTYSHVQSASEIHLPIEFSCLPSELFMPPYLPTSAGSLKKQESSRKTSIYALLTMPKPLTVWITIKCGKFWRRWEYQTTWPASWETCMQIRKQQLELDMEQDWFHIGKGVHQGCKLSPWLFNLYAEYIMRNAGLEEAQAGIKIAGRNINNLRYANDTTLRAEREEELKSFLMKVKEESVKVDLKLNIQKTKIMASGPITSWQIDGETVETVSDHILGGSTITADGDCSHEIKRRLLLGRKAMTNIDSILKSRHIITLPTKSI